MHFDRARSARIFPTAAKNRGFGATEKPPERKPGSERSRTDDLSLHPSSQFAVADPASRVYPGFFPLSLLFARAAENDHRWGDQKRKAFSAAHSRFEFDQISYLMLLCTAFLVLVFINGAFKYT